MYDQAKLEAAVDEWARQRCKLGYGQHYWLELLKDFEQFCEETGMMKASPGRVAFGRQLRRIGLEPRRLNGSAYWTGIRLLTPPAAPVEPLRYKRTEARREEAAATRSKVASARKRKAVLSPTEREKRAESVKKRMARESKAANLNVSKRRKAQ